MLYPAARLYKITRGYWKCFICHLQSQVVLHEEYYWEKKAGSSTYVWHRFDNDQTIKNQEMPPLESKLAVLLQVNHHFLNQAKDGAAGSPREKCIPKL